MCPRSVPHSSTALPRTAAPYITPWLPAWLTDQDQGRGWAIAWINIWGLLRPHRHTPWWATGACRPQRVSQSIFLHLLNLTAATDLLIWILRYLRDWVRNRVYKDFYNSRVNKRLTVLLRYKYLFLCSSLNNSQPHCLLAVTQILCLHADSNPNCL